MVRLTQTEEQALGVLKQNLTGMLGDRLTAITLFGSRARGDFSSDSDIDIAIIVRNLTGELKNRILDQVAEIEFDFVMPLSVLVLSEEEFDNLKKRERRLALDILKGGIAL